MVFVLIPALTSPVSSGTPSARVTMMTSDGLVAATRCGRSPNDVAAAG